MAKYKSTTTVEKVMYMLVVVPFLHGVIVGIGATGDKSDIHVRNMPGYITVIQPWEQPRSNICVMLENHCNRIECQHGDLT